jgi:hypothetical protein
MATHADAAKMGKDAADSARADDPDRKTASGTRSTGLREKSQRGKKDNSGRPDTKDATRQTSSTGKRESRQTSSTGKRESRQTSSTGKRESRQTSSAGKRNSSMRGTNIFILPPELLTQIFQYLSLSDRLHFRFVRYLGIQYLAVVGFDRALHSPVFYELVNTQKRALRAPPVLVSTYYEETWPKRSSFSGEAPEEKYRTRQAMILPVLLIRNDFFRIRLFREFRIRSRILLRIRIRTSD